MTLSYSKECHAKGLTMSRNIFAFLKAIFNVLFRRLVQDSALWTVTVFCVKYSTKVIQMSARTVLWILWKLMEHVSQTDDAFLYKQFMLHNILLLNCFTKLRCKLISSLTLVSLILVPQAKDRTCQAPDSDGCYIVFTYGTDASGNFTFWVNPKKSKIIFIPYTCLPFRIIFLVHRLHGPIHLNGWS